MRRHTAVLLIAAAALACRGRSGPAQRAQQQYDVIQEGQTSGATSTINAPGEVRPPIATTTNTDTTGSFTIGMAPAPPNMPGGPAVGVMPPQQPGAMSGGMPMPPPAPMSSGAPVPTPRASPTIRVQTQPPAATTTVTTTPTTATTQPAPPPPPRNAQHRPPPTDTTTTTSSDTAPPTETQTTDTTSTEKPPTDTAPPPPPTQTDTVGGH